MVMRIRVTNTHTLTHTHTLLHYINPIWYGYVVESDPTRPLFESLAYKIDIFL